MLFGKRLRSNWRASSARCGNLQIVGFVILLHSLPCIETAIPARFVARCKDGEIFHIGVPGAVVFVAGDEDVDSVHVLGFDLGPCCVPVRPQCVDCELQLAAPRDLHPRKVRLRPLCYVQAL